MKSPSEYQVSWIMTNFQIFWHNYKSLMKYIRVKNLICLNIHVCWYSILNALKKEGDNGVFVPL